MARSGNVGFHWIVPPSTLGAEVERRRQQIPPALGAQLSALASEMEAYMKANHPWNNRTGEAERGLTAEFIDEGNVQTIAAYSQAPHGIFLENGTRYMAPRPIVGPTLLQYYAPVRAVMGEIAG